MEPSSRQPVAAFGAFVLAVYLLGCSTTQDQSAAKPQASRGPAKASVAPKRKAVEVEGVISSVGRRTITFQMERKGKVREEVVGVDEKTKIEKNGTQVKLGDLQRADKALINYEPEAYTPAIAIKVIGKGKLKKAGGGD